MQAQQDERPTEKYLTSQEGAAETKVSNTANPHVSNDNIQFFALHFVAMHVVTCMHDSTVLKLDWQIIAAVVYKYTLVPPLKSS